MQFHALEKLIELGPGYRRAFQIDDRHLILLESDGEYYLVSSICPHKGYSLLEGKLDGGELHCPFHGHRFKLADGSVVDPLGNPSDCKALETWALDYQDRDIGIWL